MPSSHAYLSASAAHRWMNCTASPTLEASIPDRGSPYAAEGTQAHAMAERKLIQYLNKEEKPMDDAEIDPDMDRYTDEYRDYCIEVLNKELAQNKATDYCIEQKVDFSGWVPKGFGTADFIVVGNHLHIIDLKYGKGVRVEAQDNPQLKLYALGAINDYRWIYPFDEVTVHIFQPRLDHISTATYSVMELWEWAVNEVKPLAQEAYKGPGKIKPGEHCRFCKYRNDCPERKKYLINAIERSKESNALTAYVLEHASEWESWIRETKENALEKALAGEKIDGFKLVEGRSNRKITNPEAVAKILTDEGLDPYRPKELKTLTALEREAGKKKFAELCKAYIEKPQGKPTLVPESDKRPALDSAEAMFSKLED